MKFQAIIIFILILLCTAGCSSTDHLSEQREQTLGKSDSDIMVGVAWPFESRNDGFKEGLELALEEINLHGVIGHAIQLVQADDLSSVTTGLAVAQSFANQLNMSAVIAHRGSAVAVPASKVYENAGLLTLAPSSTSPSLTQGGARHVFRLIPNDIQLGAKMAEYAKSQGYQHIVIFYANDEYGRGLANSFEDSVQTNGLHIIDRISDYQNAADLKRLVKKWRLLGCDAVFIAHTMPTGAQFIAQIHEAGLNVPILGGDGLDSQDLIQIAGKDAEKTVVASIFNPYLPDEHIQSFVKKYTDRYGEQPRKYSAQAYDSLHLLAEAIEKSQSRKPTHIADTLREQSWQGVSGKRLFDESGDVHQMPIVLKQVVDGKFKYID